MGQATTWRNQTRVCNGCKSEFRPTRDWQKQCSPACRTRAYRNRQSVTAEGYYGAKDFLGLLASISSARSRRMPGQ
jgi:hypothetical protein